MRYKKILTVGSTGLTLLAFVGCSKLNRNMDSNQTAIRQILESMANGAPSGSHYNLNVIGVAKNKSVNMSDSNGHVIFLPLVGSSKILLQEGPFSVIDANGTDGSASFQLPNPDPDGDGVLSYAVFARALGKPGGSSKMTTCATDIITNEVYCSVESVVSIRNKGKSTFTDVSRELLTISADVDGDGKLERYSLFDAALENFYWQYDQGAKGLKLLQLRFYNISTTVN